MGDDTNGMGESHDNDNPTPGRGNLDENIDVNPNDVEAVSAGRLQKIDRTNIQSNDINIA